MYCPMKLDCKAMTGEIHHCPNLEECLSNSPLDRMEALRLYFLNQGMKLEAIGIDEGKTEEDWDSLLEPSPTPFSYNWHSEIRDRIIFGTEISWESQCGDIKYFDFLSRGQLQQLTAQKFADPASRQNLSPTIAEFLAFARVQASKGFEFNFIGYAVSPLREDYRVSVDGMVFEGNCSFQLISEFNDFAGDADEIDIQPNYLRAWWD